MTDKPPFFLYDIPSGSFAERAQMQLKRFDEGHPESLFYAAFELRTGIEARLHEYISAAHPSRVKDYDAQKLMAKLRRRSKHADTAFRLHFRSPSGLSSTVLTYEPVTPMLIDAHAKLGDLLHFNFFRSNPDWFYTVSLVEHDPPSKSLVDVRKWLGEVVAELERVANSTLLSVGGGFADVMFGKDEED